MEVRFTTETEEKLRDIVLQCSCWQINNLPRRQSQRRTFGHRKTAVQSESGSPLQMHLPSPNTLRAAALSLVACLSAYGQGLFGSQSGTNSPALTFRVPGATLLVVTDAPYSGRTTTTNAIPRADGTPIMPSRTRETIWRDSKGRVRTEPNRQQPPALVYIDDPVSGYSYVLNPLDHIAHRAVAKVTPYTGADPFAGLVQSNPSCNPPVVDRLGTKEMSGIKATGLRSTTNCPPGTYQANDRPLAITDETWKSADYNLTLLRTRTDPVGGGNTTAIEDFKAAEPDPALFRIPPEYRVVDEIAPFTIAIPESAGRGGGPPPGLMSVRVEGPNFGYGFPLNGSLLVVTSAPYSGREVLTQDQTLADGTHLHQTPGPSPDGTKVWRDSAGKVRTEHAGRGGWTVAEIADPAGYRYVLDPWNRIAHRVPLQAFEANDRTSRQRYGLPVNDADYPSTSTNPRSGATTVAEEIGTQTLSGVSVTGYRATVTGPGPAQNGTSEVWEYSPYGLALLTKETRSTPAGVLRTVTTTIEDFSPKEPDPALFKIPDGYRIVDETGTITIKIPDTAN